MGHVLSGLGLGLIWLRLLDPTPRDRFRKHGALGHLSFWSPAQVRPIWSFVWKTWKYAPLMCSAPSKIYLFCANFGSTIAL